MLLQRLLAIPVLLAAAGCATVSPERALGVATAGKAYVETMKKVDELALERSIDFTARLLPQLPRDDKTLASHTEAMRKRIDLVGRAHAYFDGLADYFAALEALAKGDQSEANAKAAGELVDSLKNSPVELKVSDQKKQALTGLVGHISKQIHAAAVQKALERDAPVIGEALEVSGNMLEELARWIEIREKADRARSYEREVRAPYLGQGALKDDWSKAWGTHVRTAPALALLTEARKGNAEMKKAWVEVLRGHASFADLHAALKNVRAGIEAVAALKDAK